MKKRIFSIAMSWIIIIMLLLSNLMLVSAFSDSDEALGADAVSLLSETETGVVAGDTFYDAAVGDVVTYTVMLKAEELFESFQAVVSYDSTKLELVRKGEDEDEIACPNMDGLVFNTDEDGLVGFNAIKFKGMNFKKEKVLITLDFVVLDNARTSVELFIEFMTVQGGGEDYFYKGQPVKTEGITVTETVTEWVPSDTQPDNTQAPETIPEVTAPVISVPDDKGVVVDDVAYGISVGDVVTYTVTLKAEELLEDLQVEVSYDSAKLQLVRKGDDEDEIACPNLSGLVFNADTDGIVTFNATRYKGMKFTTEKILVTLEFEVLDDARSSIDLIVEYMSIKDSDENYFYKGEPVKTEGITIRELLVNQNTLPPVEGVLENGIAYYEERKGELSVTGFEGEYTQAVIIPETIEGLPVVRIKRGVFTYSDKLRVYIPGSVTIIENNSFDVQDVHIVFGGTSAQWKAVLIGNGNEEVYSGTIHYSGEIDAYSHSTVEPDCLNGGYVLHSCIYCDDTYKTDFTHTADHFVTDGKCIYCEGSFDVIESDHNYDSNADKTWIVKKVGSNKVVLKFSEKTMVEQQYDRIYIYDKNDEQVGIYTGSELAGVRVEVNGDTAKVRLVSNDKNEFYGFRAEYSFETSGRICVCGDATGDDKVNVRDATQIQKAVASLVVLTEVQEIAADVDSNGVVNVRDATAIQKWVAQIETGFPVGEDIF